MAEFPAMPFWTDAYLGDTGHLTTLEHGAYLLLLFTAWRTKDGDLPDDDKMLARYCRLGPKQWRKIRPILEPFFDIRNGLWTQGRLKDEHIAVRALSNRQRKKIKDRWLKNKQTASTGTDSGMVSGNTSPSPNPSPKESPSIPQGFLRLDDYEFQQYRKNCPSLSDDEVRKVLDKADLMFYADGGKNWPARLIGILKAAEAEAKKKPKSSGFTLDDIDRARGLIP